MKGLFASLGLALVNLACAAGDNGVFEGARDNCAFGGDLTDCPDAERTPMAACWRLVDCGAIPLDGKEDYEFDWGNCVGAIDRLRAERQNLVMNCIAASTCDQLRDPDRALCFELGGG